MKRINLKKVVLASVLMTVSSFALANEQATEDYQADEFSSVNINVPATIQFVESDIYTVSIIADDCEVEKGLKYFIEDDELTIGMDYGMNAEELNNHNILIIVSAPSMPEINVGKDFKMM